MAAATHGREPSRTPQSRKGSQAQNTATNLSTLYFSSQGQHCDTSHVREVCRERVTWTVSVTAHNRGLFLFCITVEPVPGVEGGKPVIYSEAVQALRKLQQENPGKAGGLKILRLSELSVTKMSSKRSSRSSVQSLTSLRRCSGQTVLPRVETVSKCHPEAIAEGSRLRKQQTMRDSSLMLRMTCVRVLRLRHSLVAVFEAYLEKNGVAHRRPRQTTRQVADLCIIIFQRKSPITGFR